jgi:hypothetical protein
MKDPRGLIGGGFPLGERWAIELIADVLPGSAARKVRPHHIGTLEGILYRARWLFNEPGERFKKRVTIGLRLLEDAFDRNPQLVSSSFGDATDRLGDLQQTEHNLHRDAWAVDKSDPDRRFRSLLALYQMTYERYYRTLAAPFVVAARIVQKVSDPPAAVDSDGRVKLATVVELEAGRGITDQSLTLGLDNHLRNSAAHSHFDIVDEDRIRMWDIDPRSGKYSWGPETLSFWDLRQRVYALSVTALVLLAAIVLFDIANGQTMFNRGWLKPQLRARRNDVLRSELSHSAELHGFAVDAVTQTDTELVITLRVLGIEMADQISEIRSGGAAGPGPRLVQEIRTLRASAWKQVYGFLQFTYDLHGFYDVADVVLRNADGDVIGDVSAPRDVREAMVMTDEDPAELRARTLRDTLPDTEIPVVIKGPPRRA